ncbi:hypothetical protein [Micromonospora sp. NPDC048843]|uniref:hypothetical protein n=1 Tax=Micromonospora sp. NPDC048843 TaxID=3155389 RepID=UPI0033DECEB0
MRKDWTALPESVTAAIAERIGGTLDVTPASSGDHAEIASTVTGPAGQIFVKAASGELSVRSLRYEPAVPGPSTGTRPQSCGSSNPTAGGDRASARSPPRPFHLAAPTSTCSSPH